MSFLGKLKTAIVGNPVLKEYELVKHVASAGPGLLWKVYNGIKKSTKQEVSVFIFYKQTPEVEKIPKKRREELFEMLKRGPTHLARLRHPKILTIDHPVEESSDCIAFTTEPIFASLANVLGYYDNLPTPLPLVIKEYQLHTLEAHYGLLQIAEALNFLHNDVKMMHGNLMLNNILISRHGDWKLAGFNFASFVQYQTTAQTTFKFSEWNTDKSLPTNPSLDYLAPEYILSESCSHQSDLYSYGMLTFAVYNGGKPLFDCHNNTLTFKHNIEQISRISESALGDTPLQLRPLVRSLLAIEPSVRPDALQITNHTFFDDVLVSALRYIDALVQKNDMEKSQWFKNNLGRLITKFPKRVIHQRILPAISQEFRNHKMIPFVLPLVLLIAEDCTMQEYDTLILPVLIPAFSIYQPIQIPLIFLQKMDLLLKKTSPEQMKKHILPMILGSMGSDNNQVQELCVSILPTFADMIDYTSMKHSIIPRITDLYVNTTSSSLRIKCLLAVGQMLESLDKYIIMENILPTISKISSREPGVLMGILGIYHKTMTSKGLGFERQYLANKALPYLIPLSMDSGLNVPQFNQFMMVIKEMIKKIENEQRAHLDQLTKMEEQTKSTVQFAQEVAENKAQEDTAKAIQNLGGGGGGGDSDVIVSKVGSHLPSKTSPIISKNDDIFSGLGLDTLQLSTPPLVNKTTPTGTSIQSMKRIDFSEAKVTATPTQSFIGDTWELPTSSPTTSTAGLFSGMKMTQSTSSGDTAAKTRSGSQNDWVSGINGNPNNVPITTKNQSNMGWSSDISQPHAGMGMELMQPKNYSGTTSMGMEHIQPQTHSGSSTGWSSDISKTMQHHSGMGMEIMQPNKTHSGSSTGQSSDINKTMQSHSGTTSMGMERMQPQNHSGMQSHSGNTSMGMEHMQPQTHSGSSTGWSSDISKTMQHSGMGMEIMQPNKTHSGSLTGWSSDINKTMQSHSSTMGMGFTQPLQTHSGSLNMGWSSQPQTDTSMGIMQPLQPTISMNPTTSSQTMGWSSDINKSTQPHHSDNMGMGFLQPQIQPHSGVNSALLQPQNQSMGIMQPQIQTSMGTGWSSGPAPGPNPFADFNNSLL